MTFRKLTQSLFRRGKGLHSGVEYGLSIEPSDEALSLRADGGAFLPVSLLALEGGGRGSDLIFPDGGRVRTCEHVLSALTGAGVWRARITVTGGAGDGEVEMPGLDGCAGDLAREIMEKSEPAYEGPEPLRLAFPVYAGDAGKNSRFLVALPSSVFRLTYVIDYAAAPIGTQLFDYEGGPEEFLRDIAPARTFAMRSDIEALRAAGLALGGSPGNAIVVDDAGVETAGGLRFQDEFVRHKVLDLLGDLAALGRPLVAHVAAVRAGHAQHLRLTEKLRVLSRGA
ncbi:MAG: UDP-3-O-acyl-N-acetylglucosamine deacetylase [Synergistaceae bacterium]|jgi:UDP-3-O-[3-hydroxymyristoyl] N-acetylglucosamine deacetylase|nr:UDP-3-O-acyl-N-acetylglucosamine deacetylase [Synergistaceae bacterium]